VEIWNSLAGVEPLERFTSRRVAVARIWKAIQYLEPAGGHRRTAPTNKATKKKASREVGPRKREKHEDCPGDRAAETNYRS